MGEGGGKDWAGGSLTTRRPEPFGDKRGEGRGEPLEFFGDKGGGRGGDVGVLKGEVGGEVGIEEGGEE